MGIGGKRSDREIRRKILKMVVTSRKEDARILGERRVTEGESKGKGRKAGMGVREKIGGRKRGELARRCLKEDGKD